MYDDDEVLKNSAKQLVAKGVKINEVFSPFPIHGIDPIIGVKNTRLGIMAFLYGLTGLTLATVGMRFFMIVDWPMNIGGKPHFAFPDFIPIMFELTVLFAAFGMVGTYFFANHLAPGRAPRVMDLRATNDRFVIAIDAKTNLSHDQIDNILKEAGAVEVKHNERKYVSYE
jgi:hypothetical protein